MQTPPAIKNITVKIHNLKTFSTPYGVLSTTYRLKKFQNTLRWAVAQLGCTAVAESSGFFNFFCTQARDTVARSMKITTFRVCAQVQPDRFYGWGYILINNQKIPISKIKLLKLIETRKKQALFHIKNWSDKDFKDFQVLVNGIFQAEGYIGGRFTSINKYNFSGLRPTELKISKNASIASVDFLCLFWVVLGKKFRFTIGKTSQNIYHISLETSGWKTILNLTSYFSDTYGYKYRSFLILKDMHSLLKSGSLTNETIGKIIILGNSQVELSQKKISLSKKFLTILNEKFDEGSPLPSAAARPRGLIEKIYTQHGWALQLHRFFRKKKVLKTYSDNKRSLSMLFILGFILGDGNFLIRIRDTGKRLWFIPIFRILKKNVLLNRKLLENISNFLQGLGINSRTTAAAGKEKGRLRPSGLCKPPCGRLLCLSIEGKGVKAFYSLLSEHKKWFFWKKIQFSPLDKYFVISDVAARHWKNAQLALLWEIYSSNAFPRSATFFLRKKSYKKNNFEFWKNKLDIYFKNKLISFQSPKSYNSLIANLSEGLTKEDLFYICVSKNISWLVTLPTTLKIKPKQKYFFFKTYGGDKEKALIAAIEYRDNSLNNWLMNNGFKVK